MTPLPDPAVGAMLDYAKAKTEDGSLVAYYEALRTSTNPEDRWRWSQVVASYGIGLPGKRPEEKPLELGELAALAARLGEASGPDDAAKPLNSPVPGGRPALPPVPTPPEPEIAPPTPAPKESPIHIGRMVYVPWKGEGQR